MRDSVLRRARPTQDGTRTARRLTARSRDRGPRARAQLRRSRGAPPSAAEPAGPSEPGAPSFGSTTRNVVPLPGALSTSMLPAVVRHDVVHHREAEPRALADLLRREEEIEALRLDLRRHPDAVVARSRAAPSRLPYATSSPIRPRSDGRGAPLSSRSGIASAALSRRFSATCCSSCGSPKTRRGLVLGIALVEPDALALDAVAGERRRPSGRPRRGRSSAGCVLRGREGQDLLDRVLDAREPVLDELEVLGGLRGVEVAPLRARARRCACRRAGC